MTLWLNYGPAPNPYFPNRYYTVSQPLRIAGLPESEATFLARIPDIQLTYAKHVFVFLEILHKNITMSYLYDVLRCQ